MRLRYISVLSILFIGLGVWSLSAQTTSAGSAEKSQPAASAPAAPAAPAAPLHLNNIVPPKKIQFPPADLKNFTAASPSVEEVNAFLKQLWGYDPNRVWQVAGIQKTDAPNLSRVTVEVAMQGVSHAPATMVFFVTPDGKHAVAGASVIAFGAHPFAAVQEKLKTEAVGPYRGANSKELLLVEFADLECPHCKDAAGTMDRLATDFPNARIVFENFPLIKIHPAAQRAAEYGVCVAKLQGNAAFFQYVQAVYDTQAKLTSDADGTLNDAVTKAGGSPAAVSACAAEAPAKAAVAASVKLGQEIGVDQTPLLFINGRMVPIDGVPYNILKQIVTYENTGSGN